MQQLPRDVLRLVLASCADRVDRRYAAASCRRLRAAADVQACRAEQWRDIEAACRGAASRFVTHTLAWRAGWLSTAVTWTRGDGRDDVWRLRVGDGGAFVQFEWSPDTFASVRVAFDGGAAHFRHTHRIECDGAAAAADRLHAFLTTYVVDLLRGWSASHARRATLVAEFTGAPVYASSVAL